MKSPMDVSGFPKRDELSERLLDWRGMWEAHPWAISLIVVASALALREILRNVLGDQWFTTPLVVKKK